MRGKLILMLAIALLSVTAAQAQGTLPIGSTISVTVDENVSSKTASVGQKVSGSVANNVTINGKVVIPKGSKANLTVATAQSAGKFKGQPKLWLRLESVVVRGRTYSTSTNLYGRTGASRGKRTAIGAGGGAATGAVIGALAGGGAGAAIGAGVGAGAGTGAAALTGKTEVVIRAEQRATFTLKTALTVQ